MAGVNTWNAASNALLKGGDLLNEMVRRRTEASQKAIEYDNAMEELALRRAEAERVRKAAEEKAAQDALDREAKARADAEKAAALANRQSHLDQLNTELSMRGPLSSDEARTLIGQYGFLGSEEGTRAFNTFYNPENALANRNAQASLQDDRQDWQSGEYALNRKAQAANLGKRLAAVARMHRDRLSAARKTGVQIDIDEAQAALNDALESYAAWADSHPSSMRGIDQNVDAGFDIRKIGVINAQRNVQNARANGAGPGAGSKKHKISLDSIK